MIQRVQHSSTWVKRAGLAPKTQNSVKTASKQRQTTSTLRFSVNTWYTTMNKIYELQTDSILRFKNLALNIKAGYDHLFYNENAFWTLFFSQIFFSRHEDPHTQCITHPLPIPKISLLSFNFLFTNCIFCWIFYLFKHIVQVKIIYI